ncbi:MAG: Hsp20/alpha crystallin family protein [Halodesulfurarchaeum sp.]
MESNAQIRSDVPVRRYHYDEKTEIVADFGAAATEASVEVLDDLALVVLPTEDGDQQYEIELPGEDVADTFITNGVLTIEVNEQ